MFSLVARELLDAFGSRATTQHWVKVSQRLVSRLIWISLRNSPNQSTNRPW